MHNFRDSWAWAEGQGTTARWAALYESVWPGCTVERVTDLTLQRNGVDSIVTTAGGVVVWVDEKTRRKDYGDFLCEVYSVCQDVTPDGDPIGPFKLGWTVDPTKQTHYVAYATIENETCRLLPFELLRLACTKNFRGWIVSLGGWPKFAQNNGYKTACLPVPWPVLFEAMEQVYAWPDVQDGER